MNAFSSPGFYVEPPRTIGCATTATMAMVVMMNSMALVARADNGNVPMRHANGRAFDEAEAIYRTMPPVRYRPPLDRWRNLPRTARILGEGRKELRVLTVGDQLMDDLARSGWANQVHERHPLTEIQSYLCVHPEGGCRWFREKNRVQNCVLVGKPDLLIVGGNGECGDADVIAEVIRQVREQSECDILLLGGAFNGVDPWGQGQWSFEIPPDADNCRARLQRLAEKTHCAFLDMTAHWGRYVRDVAAVEDVFREETRVMDYFTKDDGRSPNPRGEQILGRILAAYLTGAVVPGDEGVILFTGTYSRGERPNALTDRNYRQIPPVTFTPAPGRWARMPRSRDILSGHGGEWRVVLLGDSIIADTSHSCWDRLVQLEYPDCEIERLTVVRGSTGCWWYKDAGRVERYVLAFTPDLLIIGGISQRDDIESIADVIKQVRRESDCDILLMTGPFGKVDPHDDTQRTFDIPEDEKDYRNRLRRLAGDSNCAFLDMAAHWGQYVRMSGKDVDYFKRDDIHANPRGEQILGHILRQYFRGAAE